MDPNGVGALLDVNPRAVITQALRPIPDPVGHVRFPRGNCGAGKPREKDEKNSHAHWHLKLRNEELTTYSSRTARW